MANFFKSLFFGESEKTEEQKNEHNFDVFKYDGMKAERMGKNKYAIRCFQEALDIREDTEVLEHLTSVYTKEDRLDDAIETAGRWVEAEPENVRVRLLRANLNYMAGDYDRTISDCEKTVELDATEGRAHYMAGRAKKMKGDAVGAIVSLSQAIALKEDYAEAWLLRAEIMLETGDYADGLQDAAKAVEAMAEHYGSKPENIRSAIGPNIGACHFETHRDVPDALEEALGSWVWKWISCREGKYFPDLKQINSEILRLHGVKQVEISEECTYCAHQRFWSHRYTKGDRGSQGALIVCREVCL